MSNPIKGTVALITGGATGIGFCFAQELLRNGARSVSIADLSDENGRRAVETLEKEFGANKVIFIKTDVTNKSQFEEAFEKTVKTFGNVDVLINNVGILDGTKWELEIAVNINAVVYGTILGIDKYLPKYKTGTEGIIVNISSAAGIQGWHDYPVYSTTKHAIIGLGQAFGSIEHYEATNIRVLTICPGFTKTSIVQNMEQKQLPLHYNYGLDTEYFENIIWQGPEDVARGLIKVINEGKTGSIWMIEEQVEPYEVVIPHWKQLRV